MFFLSIEMEFEKKSWHMFCLSIEMEFEKKPWHMFCLSIEMEILKKPWAYVLFEHRNGNLIKTLGICFV